MTPSQRVTLLKEISGRLAAEEWPVIDVTLDHFGLPTSDEWQGDRISYILHMMKDASDSVLVELAVHTGFAVEHVAMPSVEPTFWHSGMFRLFISHLSSHKKFAAQLQTALWDLGVTAFVAHKDIEPTREWQTQIETALSTADALVALLHPGFHASNWTDQEIGFAMGRGVPVFSVRLGQDPYGFIGRFQAFAGNEKTASTLAQELFHSFRKNKRCQGKMAEPLVRLFENSSSFAEAKTCGFQPCRSTIPGEAGPLFQPCRATSISWARGGWMG